MGFNMSDLGGLAFIDRVGSGALGGVGTNYIANLIIGSTWSYVTGGPEFTNQPPANTAVNIGQNASLTGGAIAAGQTVSYQWVKITNAGATTNNVNNGAGGAGGSATVSGANTATLTLTGVTAGDTGNYQLVATASGTHFNLNSATAAVALTDPQITTNPTNAASIQGTITLTNVPAGATNVWVPVAFLPGNPCFVFAQFQTMGATSALTGPLWVDTNAIFAWQPVAPFGLRAATK